ncbi:hypothetical protein DSM106972_061830 [Dulcicalothrix desertica PCC 7102]|uniref:EF-hand domain-containing protein n=1 Tax=Dulcicalothrix desertica PCC 7102 TaxID=232991 RepID=A0A3S1C869_9CYAN|nr:GUN4 domain-containing protein [Dulcicalothrix desertica]RUT02108.1 hypothetical protein DSM106972_061830 [Dulcicalothrix desertica PCC 7102]TWH53753.1 putative caspase-like protein [Dulcicalothrix desertica PCC 7102]
MAKYALLIGVSEYEPGLNLLPGATKDVEAMQRVLQHPEIGGFAAEDIIVLKNQQRQEAEEAIFTFFANKRKEDLLLLYFSGHGITDDNSQFYFSTRSTRKQEGKLISPTAVAASFVHQQMQNSRSRRQVIILDCCFSAAFTKGLNAKDAGNINIVNQLGGEGRAILTASNSTQYAFEHEGFELSLYTHFLIEGIEKGIADQDNDGWISVEELHDFVHRKVTETSPAMTPEFYPVKEGYKILLAKSPKEDPKLKYRKEVEQRAHQGKFTIPARRMLKSLALQLGLNLQEAEAIETEVLQPYREYQRKLEEYKQTLEEALEQENPLSSRSLNDLKDYQQFLGLRDEDVKKIDEQLLPQIAFVINNQQPVTNNQQLEEDDLSSEKGINYTKLRDLIKTGKWKEADYETYLIMLQAVGREENDWIRHEEFLNFPYKDLRTINTLWVKYSNGQFGFSVQKEIYLSVGGKADGKYYKEAWEKLADKVGWRVNNNWIDTRSFTYDTSAFYDTSASKGHLPIYVFVHDVEKVGAIFTDLEVVFSRIETCKM